MTQPPDPPVEVQDHNPAWFTWAADTTTSILELVDPSSTTIEHIGSTAVPGLAAKPIIDLMAGVTDLDEVANNWPRLLAPLQLTYKPEYESDMPERRYFARRASEHPPAIHLHVVVLNSPFWRRHLAFRDHLRANPTDRDAYANLKRALAEQHRHDRPAYTDAKTEFIQSIERRALT